MPPPFSYLGERKKESDQGPSPSNHHNGTCEVDWCRPGRSEQDYSCHGESRARGVPDVERKQRPVLPNDRDQEEGC